jgi:predicted Zn-dependent protease
VADWTDNERAHVADFDRALALRDANDLPAALALLQTLVGTLTQSDARMLLHAHLQIVNILERLDRTRDAEVHARFAVQLAPRAELASLALFHVLVSLRRSTEALREALRFLTARESLGYREVFAGDAYTKDAPAEQRELAKDARRLLAKHRDEQRTRTTPQPRDTVRIRASAPSTLRPGSLATVYSVDGPTLKLAFSDGTIVEVPASLVDMHDL